jgi:ribonuclease HI
MGQNVTYSPLNVIKSQVLADFVDEWTEMQTPPALIENETWTMYFDASVMKEGAGVGLVFISSLGVRMEYMVRLHFLASNNAAEYEALINGLRIAVKLEIKRLEIRGDSELVVGQVMKDKNCVDPKMVENCQAMRDLEGKFHGLELHHVLHDYNKAVDVLAKAASSRSLVPHDIFASDQHQPSVREGEKPTDIDYDSPWVRAYTEEENQVALEDAIDQLDEARDVALLRSAKYQQALWRYHERNMHPREFHIGDLVLRRVQGSKDRHKLSPP